MSGNKLKVTYVVNSDKNLYYLWQRPCLKILKYTVSINKHTLLLYQCLTKPYSKAYWKLLNQVKINECVVLSLKQMLGYAKMQYSDRKLNIKQMFTISDNKTHKLYLSLARKNMLTTSRRS